MKYIINQFRFLLLVLIFFSIVSFRDTHDQTKGSLIIHIDNINNDKGQLGLCLFNSATGFPNHSDKAISCIFIKFKGNSAEYTFANLQFGNYAVCVFHDENSDKKINSNFMGIPSEGIGVSNNAKGSFGPPKYEDAKFEFNKQRQSIKISLNYF